MALLAVCLLAVLLGGCSLPGGGADAPVENGAPATAAQETFNGPLGPGETPVAGTPAPTPTPAPVVGGHVTELIPLYPRNLNPLFAENETETRVASLLFDGLMEIDPETALPAPALAREVRVSDDGLRYTFALRPALRWHDGSPVTARDVVWTLDALRDPAVDAQLRPYAERIARVSAPDARTVVVTLAEPYAPFLARVATAPVLPRAPFARLEGERLRAALLGWDRPVGTGPFRWAAARPGQSLDLAANPRYHGGAPLLDRYAIRVLRDPAAIGQALAGGEADIVWLPPALAGEIARQDFLTRTPLDTPTTTMLVFNLDPAHKGPLLDGPVRRALAHALDLDAVSEAMGEGMRPVTGYQPPTSFAYAAGSARPFPHDPPRARALLDRAGWRDADRDGVREKAGRDLELTLYANEVPDAFPRVLGTSYTPALERIAADWAAVGVRVAVREEGWEALAGRLFGAHDFDAALLSASGDADPDTSYLWGTEAYADGFNAGRYSDKVVDALLDEGLHWRDAPRRVRLYAELDRLLAEDAPAIPVGATRVALVRNNRLSSAADTYWAAIQHSDVEEWYVEDGR